MIRYVLPSSLPLIFFFLLFSPTHAIIDKKFPTYSLPSHDLCHVIAFLSALPIWNMWFVAPPPDIGLTFGPQNGIMNPYKYI